MKPAAGFSLDRFKWVLAVLVFTLLAACQDAPPPDPALPTRAAAAVVPTATPVPPTATRDETIPPTLDFTTLTVNATSTTPPTPRPTSTPEPIDAVVNITAPVDGDQLVLGTNVVASGLARLDAGQTLSVVLVATSGRTILELPTAVNENSSWQAAFTVPQNVSGPAQLQVVIRAADGSVVVRDFITVTLAVDTTIADRYLALSRPAGVVNVVEGYYMYFAGFAERPAGNQITLQILTNECQFAAATQSFAIGGSGFWRGYIYVPRNVTGPACAVAFTGTPGDPAWREAQVPITILAENDENAYLVTINSPVAGTELLAGQTVTVHGLAYNAQDDLVQVTLIQDDALVLAQAVASVGDFGYWEIDLILPLDSEGEAQMTAIIGEVGEPEYAQDGALITILPAPTPEP